MTNHRLALAKRFAPRIPNTDRTAEPATGGNRLLYARTRRRARVGRTEPVELYLDPATLVTYYRQIFNADPTIWTLGLITFSVGRLLAELRERATEVEAVGGGSLQVRLELDRRVEDWVGLTLLFAEALRAQYDPEEDADEIAAELGRRLFTGYPQDQGLWDYEAGGGTSHLPPPRGMIWEVGTLSNQVWAMWHPISWIGSDPDEPWWSWIPQAIAAGWLLAANDVQGVISTTPEQGPGWGAQLGQASEQTEAKLVELGQQGSDALGELVEAAGNMAMAGVGVALLALVLLKGKR